MYDQQYSSNKRILKIITVYMDDEVSQSCMKGATAGI